MDAIQLFPAAKPLQKELTAKEKTSSLRNRETPDPRRDRIELSEEALRRNREEIEKLRKEQAAQQETMRQQLESANAQAEAMREQAEILGKCITIAMRIISGGKVPQADYRYLAKNNTELFGRAVSLRMPCKDPKEYKRLSEDEEDQAASQPVAEASGNDITAGESAPAPDGVASPSPAAPVES